MKGKRKKGQCIFCGEIKEITDDHIPSKNLFSKPRPNNLITVPSCDDCNKSASKDEEYFRDMLILRDDLFFHPDIQKIWPSVERSFKRPQAKGYTKSFIKSTEILDVFTPAGIYLGHTGTYYVNLSRFDNVIVRYVKGIFYHEFNRRLPDNYKISAHIIYNLNNEQTYIIKQGIDFLRNKNPIKIGNDVFSYVYRSIDNDENTLVGLFLFYKKLPYIFYIIPRKQ